ncbi:hypothetical protein ASPZODRAFT_128519 [Penicilliopsis zonata CBS 506.65]|uniref:Reverse transcriptase domain-containing protein n=1 Tax=Penicilliopsis zonata CBS 506.65 TaxID=1073090 RepID=A0A1L9SRY0_9EURO|nr:hypothetical protein ASPZODRAFT_128519 [Penicilliopsis zonata CBS 506.65]OJJ49938.1 hypothetical protein ASPZODRAFT_128519 [Penicilliopsis zonata CBS 506.65]
MASSGALPQTLKSITATKITELSKQRALFETRRDAILQAVSEAPDNRAKAQVLLEGVCRLKGFPYDAFDADDNDDELDGTAYKRTFVSNCTERARHANIRRFLIQGRYDASVSDSMLKNYIDELEQELKNIDLKHQHASFYSELVNEWLGELNEASTAESITSNTDLVSVGRAEMHEQRAQWEALVFAPSEEVQADSINCYLDGLFKTNSMSKQALKDLRERIRNFGMELSTKSKAFTVESLEFASNALLKSDLLSKEKTGILKEFMRNKEVIQEVADVLNMRLASLGDWRWDPQGVPLEMRRQLNGKYRVFMDEDLLDALMFQYLGTYWSVEFRDAFVAFMNTKAWKFLHDEIPKRQRDRRKYFLGDSNNHDAAVSVNDLRRETFKADYFMTLLPSSVEEGKRSYDDPERDEDETDSKNPLDVKHSLLHLLISESLIYKRTNGQFTVIRSDFKWFGPSLSHTTILTVLAYFGVPQTWLDFFKMFLEAPMKFVHDGSSAEVRVRKRGVPMSHGLSDCFSEAVLFCMDYAVNQRTEGAYLYRLHDDFWFWGREETCVNAWAAMSEFTKVMGLKFNEEKTGTACMHADATPHQGSEASSVAARLPKGDIRWGFLKLDSKLGHFIIDQDEVDAHIAELKLQLSSCHSVFSWVQAWNTYFGRFFSNNFAKPAMCFGRRHIDMAIETLSRVERAVFFDANETDSGCTATTTAGVTEYLRKVIRERFHMDDLPEGFFYFPVELGGLEVVNPVIPLLGMREDIKQTPERRLEKAFLQDEAQYHAAKERFEKQGSKHDVRPESISDDDDLAHFFSLEEYMRYPESRSDALLDAYTDLNSVPDLNAINQTAALQRSMTGLAGARRGQKPTNVISADWHHMSPYWRWVGELYQDDMVRRYGSLAAVEREFMPLGVVKTLKEGRLRWQG